MRLRLFVVALLSIFMQTISAQGIRLPEVPRNKPFKQYSEQKRGFWFAAEGGVGSTVEHMRNIQMATLMVTAGYRFSEYLRVGAGVGGHYYFNNSDIRGTSNRVSIPIFANARGSIMSQEIQTAVPYWSLSAGYKSNDGAFVRPGIGMRFGEVRNAFIIAINYEYGELRKTDSEKMKCSSFHLSLGYEF